MPLQKIQEFAGHSTMRQTIDYLKISDDHEEILGYLETPNPAIAYNIFWIISITKSSLISAVICLTVVYDRG